MNYPHFLTLGPETVPQAQVQPPPPTRRGQRRGAYQPPQPPQPPLPPRMMPQQPQLLPQAYQQPQQLHPQLMQLAHQRMMAQQQPPQMLQLPPHFLQQLQPHQLLQLLQQLQQLQQHPQMLHHPQRGQLIQPPQPGQLIQPPQPGQLIQPPQPEQLIQPPHQPQFSVAQHLLPHQLPQQPFQPRMPNFPAVNPDILRILMAGQMGAAPQSNLAPVGFQGGALEQQPAIHPAPQDRRVLRQAEIATPPAYSSTPQGESSAPSTSRSIQGISPNGPLGHLAQIQVPSFSPAGGQIMDAGTAAGRWEALTEENRRAETAAIQGRVPVAQQYAQEAQIDIVANPALVTVDPNCRYNPASPGLIGAQDIDSRRDGGETPVALLQVREEDLLPGGRLCPITIESPEIPRCPGRSSVCCQHEEQPMEKEMKEEPQKAVEEEAMEISPPETGRFPGNEAQISPGNDSGFNDASPEAGRSLNSEEELRADAPQVASPQDFDFPQFRREEEEEVAPEAASPFEAMQAIPQLQRGEEEEEEAGDRQEENERGDEPAGGAPETIAPIPQSEENEQFAKMMEKKHEERRQRKEERRRREEEEEEEAQDAGQEELMPVERDPVVVPNNEPERRAVTPIRLKIPFYPSHTHPRRSKRIVQPCIPSTRREASPLLVLDTKKNCGMCTIHKVIAKKYHKPCQFNTPEHLDGCRECYAIKKKRNICLALNKKR